MAWMRSVRRASASFVEQKFVQMLNQPLQSSGRLIYVAPDELQKETLAPARSALIVEGDHLTVQQPDGKVRQLSLSEFPELGALVESMRATLAGDPATLERFYIPTLPAPPTTGRCNSNRVIRGCANCSRLSESRAMARRIRTVETVEDNGDRTVMTITPDLADSRTMMPGRRVIIAVWLMLLLAGCIVITRTEFSSDMSAFLPRSPSPAQQVLVDQLHEGVVSRLILLAIEGAPPDTLAALSKRWPAG